MRLFFPAESESAQLMASWATFAIAFGNRFALAPDASDIGVYGRKRALLDSEHWCLAGTRGAELVPQLQPAAGDLVFVKNIDNVAVATLSVLGTASPPRSRISLAVFSAGPSSSPSPETDPPRSLMTMRAPRDLAIGTACATG